MHTGASFHVTNCSVRYVVLNIIAFLFFFNLLCFPEAHKDSSVALHRVMFYNFIIIIESYDLKFIEYNMLCSIPNAVN